MGIKFDNTSIEKPKTIVIEVFIMATPTVLWHFHWNGYVAGPNIGFDTFTKIDFINSALWQ